MLCIYPLPIIYSNCFLRSHLRVYFGRLYCKQYRPRLNCPIEFYGVVFHRKTYLACTWTYASQLCYKVSKSAKIRNRYNQVPHLTQDANGKVTDSQ